MQFTWLSTLRDSLSFSSNASWTLFMASLAFSIYTRASDRSSSTILFAQRFVWNRMLFAPRLTEFTFRGWLRSFDCLFCKCCVFQHFEGKTNAPHWIRAEANAEGLVQRPLLIFPSSHIIQSENISKHYKTSICKFNMSLKSFGVTSHKIEHFSHREIPKFFHCASPGACQINMCVRQLSHVQPHSHSVQKSPQSKEYSQQNGHTW